MEKSVLLLDIGFPIFHTCVLIRKVPKGIAFILFYLKGVDLVSIRGDYGSFLCLVIDLCSVVPEYSMEMGGYNDKISFNGIELCGIGLSSSESRSVNWHIQILPNNIRGIKFITPMQQ